jgi:hypothetical protein
MPGFELGLVLKARGFLASEGNDWVLSLAEASERGSLVVSVPDILMVAVARDSFNELGRVKVRTTTMKCYYCSDG